MKPNFEKKNPISLKKAFTLVELLVVIVIIAALAALSSVGYRSIMASARESKSLGNMRQLAIATIASAGDNNGFIPLGDKGSGGGRGIIWINVIAPNLGFSELADQPLNRPRDGMDQWTHLLTKYKDAPFVCSGFVKEEIDKAKAATRDAIGGIGYNASPWLPTNGNANSFWNVGTGAFKAPVQLSSINRESSRCMYASSYDWHLFDSARAFNRFGRNKAAMVFWDGSARFVNRIEFNRAIENPLGQ